MTTTTAKTADQITNKTLDTIRTAANAIYRSALNTYTYGGTQASDDLSPISHAMQAIYATATALTDLGNTTSKRDPYIGTCSNRAAYTHYLSIDGNWVTWDKTGAGVEISVRLAYADETVHFLHPSETYLKWDLPEGDLVRVERFEPGYLD